MAELLLTSELRARRMARLARASAAIFLMLAVPVRAAPAATQVTSAAPSASPTPAQRNLLINGNLAKGSENQPDNWRTEAWINGPDAFRYNWVGPHGATPGTLEVDNLKPDDGRWMQSLTLQPGWYYCSVELRTENVGTAATGASISVMEDGIMSADVRGTTDWQRLGFYVRISGRGADVDIALRVGGFSSLNVGRAFFRDARVVRIAAPPPGAERVFDLTAIRKASATAPIGRPYTLVATFILLAGIAIWGWRRLAFEGSRRPVVNRTAPPSKPKPGRPK